MTKKEKDLIFSCIVCLVGVVLELLFVFACINHASNEIEKEQEKEITIQSTEKMNEIVAEVAEEPETEVEQEPIEPEPQMYSLGMFTATAYCPCEKCCGIWALNRPLDENGQPIVYTASGTRATEGVTIAADTNILPFGTELYINGNKYIVHDRGGAINGNRIDIYFQDHNTALSFGRQNVEVFKVG